MSFTICVYIIEFVKKQRFFSVWLKKMSQNLLFNMYYAAPELWYFIGAVVFFLLCFIFYLLINILKIRQKNYFLNRDRERCIEMLYASKDGYFSFIYPDTNINDPRKQTVELCSRRLAVMLALNNGRESRFDDVLKCFYKDDAKKLQKYIDMLRDDGVPFEEIFAIKNNGRVLKLAGSRISDAKGNVYCDVIWVRDISDESNKIDELEAESHKALDKITQQNDLIDNLAYPAWLRDENLHLKFVNKRYLDYVQENSRDEIIEHGVEILDANGESISLELATSAHATIKTKKKKVSLIKDGQRRSFEITEIPFHAEQSLDKIYSVGSMCDVTELDDLKRNLKIHQNAHLEILGALGTAFAVFDGKKNLAFYNKAFAAVWQLESTWLDGQPSYSAFLDEIREKRLLPEVPDFILYKKGEQEAFNSILEAKEDLLHLPDGRTLRRVRAQHPTGGLFFAFEDVTDRLATRRAYNDLIAVQKEILDGLRDAVFIIAPNGRLSLYNQAYLNLWGYQEIFLQNEPTLVELTEAVKGTFPLVDNWDELKNDIISHILNMSTKSFILTKNDGTKIEVTSALLSDGSVMIVNKVVQ